MWKHLIKYRKQKQHKKYNKTATLYAPSYSSVSLYLFLSMYNRGWFACLSQVGIVVSLFFDSQQNRGVPLIQSRDAVVIFNGIGESFDVLLF